MLNRRTAEFGMACLTAAFGLTIAIGATEFGIGWTRFGPEPGTFPFIIGTIVVLASFGNILAEIRRRDADAVPLVTGEQLRRIAGFALPVVGFVVGSLVLGLYVATAIYMFATLRFQNAYRTSVSAAIALAMPVVFYILIERGFQVALLKGPLEAALGL